MKINNRCEFIGKEQENSFNKFYDKYYKFMLYHANYKMNGDYHRAQDVVQNCMVNLSKKKVFNVLSKVDEDTRKSYIVSVVNNCAVDHFRKENKYFLHTIEDIKKIKGDSTIQKEKKLDPFKKVALKMELIDIINSIKGLSPKDIRIFMYMICYDMKIGEIAKMCNITISGVRKRLLRARVSLDEDRLAWQG